MNLLPSSLFSPINHSKAPYQLSESAILHRIPPILNLTNMSHRIHFSYFIVPFSCLFSFLVPSVNSQLLNYNFYDKSCPNLMIRVRHNIWEAYRKEPRVAANLIRLHFHDCIVNSCDASVLLDDTEDIKGEKNTGVNRMLPLTFEVIDKIKEAAESECPYTVSCADTGSCSKRFCPTGPYWRVLLRRRDGTTSDAKSIALLPSPFEPLQNIISKFTSKGLDLKDVVVLSGAHSIGYAQCFIFQRRLFNFQGTGQPDPTLNTTLLTSLRRTCPNKADPNTNIAPFDSVTTHRFDNTYYENLAANTGLLESDQA